MNIGSLNTFFIELFNLFSEIVKIFISPDLLQENAEIIINDPKVSDKQVFVDLLGVQS